MATVTSSTINSSSGNLALNPGVSLGITLGTGKYPNGSITFSGPPRWKDNTGSARTINLYLASSTAGADKVKFGTLSIPGSGRVYDASFTISGATGLAGKALYLYATDNNKTTATNFVLQNATQLTITVADQSWTLTTAVSPSGYGTVTAGGSMNYGGTKSLTATPSTGRKFSSWSKTAGTLSSTTSNPTTFTMGTSNATVTANFGTNSYTLTTAVSPAGYGTVTAGGSISYGGTKSLTATPTTGHYFSSWSKTAGTLSSTTSNPTTFTMGAGNATVTANFGLSSYTLTTAVSPSGGGTVTAGGSISYGGTKSLTATPSTGYQFSSWSTTSGSLSSTTTNPTTFTMGAGNATVTATFIKINYSVTTDSDPSGAGTVTANPSTATYGDTVTLSQTPATGYAFDGYTSDPSVTITNDAFTMPASNVAITGNYHISKSSCSLDKVSYSGGDTAVLTINVASSSFTHRYQLSFGTGMETGWISLSAGVDTDNIYIPVGWILAAKGNISVSGGTLTLETYENGSLLGTYVVENLTYTALDSTIPGLSVWRCDANDNPDIEGEYVGHSETVPSSIDSYNVSYDTEPLAISSNHTVTLSMTYGQETFTLSRDIPKVVVVKKMLTNSVD